MGKTPMPLSSMPNHLQIGMVGLGMIVDETYLPCFRELKKRPLYDRDFGAVEVDLKAAASRTGRRAEKLVSWWPSLHNFSGPDVIQKLVTLDLDAICIATPDDRHFDAAKLALLAGKHVLIEKPCVLKVSQLEELIAIAKEKNVLCKVIYHKLFDPDHKKLRTLVTDGVLKHVNNGYCSLLEPKSIATGQFAEWITGRNPATYVAVHYLKLIDFTFGPSWTLKRVAATGQRGIVAASDGPTWDSVQMHVVYEHDESQREAAFDIHTNWVTPDNFPGYVEQEVQFRFDNGVWAASQRKRGVELTVEGRTPNELKNTPNYHYNGEFLEPNGESRQRGYGLEAIHDFFEQVAFVKYGPGEYTDRLNEMREQPHNDLSADRNVVIAIEALETILHNAAQGRPGGIVILRDGQYELSLP